MYKNPFEQLEDSRNILLAYAAQLKGGQAERIMCEPLELACFLAAIANTIAEALDAFDEAPLLEMPKATQPGLAMRVHETAPHYK